MNYQTSLKKVNKMMSNIENIGNVAAYIPELGNVNPNHFGVHLATIKNKQYAIGDSEISFSIQSIAKVLALTLAYNAKGGELWERVGVEPSGTPFNSLVQLEYEKGIPRNPFINAGAIVICDILISLFDNPKKELLDFIRNLAQNSNLNFDETIVKSEKSTGFRNAALINLMKDFGNIHNDIEDVLDFYFNLCSIKMTCNELANTFLFLANHGEHTITGEQILTKSRTKRMNAIMQTCGFYDEAGDFSYKVGLPGKSGVGGGIVAIHPKKYCIVVWSPRLNEKGNSYRGMNFLEWFTTETASSIF
ncbi:MAG: glutaminase [Cognaticolwellia sp.]|jgi:glutaminase